MVSILNGFTRLHTAITILSNVPNIIPDGQTLAIVERFPVFMGCTNDDFTQDVFADQIWHFDELGILTISPRIPTPLLYQNSHNHPVGETWVNHHKSFGNFVAQNLIGKVVYEIGGAHGMALVELQQQNPEIETYLHDINPIPVAEFKGTIIQSAFTASSVIPIETETIIHSHVLEHMHDPFAFLQNVATKQKVGDMHIFSWPNMEIMLERGDLNFLNFEHDKYITFEFVDSCLKNLGYEIVNRLKFQEHSTFIAAKKIRQNSHVEAKVNTKDIEIDEKISNYFEILNNQVTKFNQLLMQDYDLRFVFGAHVFTQYLIAAGLRLDLVDSILDNSPSKSGKRLYGSNLQVITPEQVFETAKNFRKILIVGSVATYAEEIISGLRTTFEGKNIQLEVCFPIGGRLTKVNIT